MQLTQANTWHLVPPQGRTAIITNGSADSVLTAAEVLRRVGSAGEVLVTRPNDWASVALHRSPRGTDVVVVGMAATHAPRSGRTPTADFLRTCRERGHRLVAVIDEHDAKRWRLALSDAGLSMDSLAIQPQSQETTGLKSAGKVMRTALGERADARSEALLTAAELCDARGFERNGLAYCANAVLKARPRDHARKVALLRWLSESSAVLRLATLEGGQEAAAAALARGGREDVRVLGWVRDYEALEREHERLLCEAVGIGDGIAQFVLERDVDMTVLLMRFMKAGVRAIYFERDYFLREGENVRVFGVGSDDPALKKLGTHLEREGILVGGYGRKPFVLEEDGPKALAIVRELLAARPRNEEGEEVTS
jgi:hypothetical protein